MSEDKTLPIFNPFRHIESQVTEIARLREALLNISKLVDYLPHPYCVMIDEYTRTALDN